jgi:uncharacterized Zn finger protein
MKTVYMRKTPLKCPKCKKKILNMITRKYQYSECPKCGYFTKDFMKFVDRSIYHSFIVK